MIIYEYKDKLLINNQGFSQHKAGSEFKYSSVPAKIEVLLFC